MSETREDPQPDPDPSRRDEPAAGPEDAAHLSEAHPAQAAQTQPDPAQAAQTQQYPAQPTQPYATQQYPAQPTQPYPAQPYPGAVVSYPTPPKKSRVGLIVGIVAAVIVVALVAIAGGVLFALRGHIRTAVAVATGSTTSPSPTASPSPEVTPSAGPDHSGDLRRFLLDAPKSSKPWSDQLGSHNAFTAKQEAADWASNKDWRLGLLTTHDFQTGAVREWDQVNTSVEVELYRFALPNNALGFFDDDTADADYFDKTSTEVLVNGVPGGRAYYTKVKDKYGTQHVFAVATCGDVAMEVWVDQYKTTPVDYAKILLRKQYARLCP